MVDCRELTELTIFLGHDIPTQCVASGRKQRAKKRQRVRAVNSRHLHGRTLVQHHNSRLRAAMFHQLWVGGFWDAADTVSHRTYLLTVDDISIAPRPLLSYNMQTHRQSVIELSWKLCTAVKNKCNRACASFIPSWGKSTSYFLRFSRAWFAYLMTLLVSQVLLLEQTSYLISHGELQQAFNNVQRSCLTLDPLLCFATVHCFCAQVYPPCTLQRESCGAWVLRNDSLSAVT